MAVADISPSYPAMFRDGIVRAATYLLGRIEQTSLHLSLDEQNQVLHILTFALKLEQAWPIARQLLLQVAPKMEQAGYRAAWSRYLEGGIEESRKQADEKTEAELRFHLGVLYKYLARFDEAQHQLEKSTSYFEQTGNKPLLARTLNRCADLARQQRRFDEAQELVERAFYLAEGIREEQAYSYLVQGIMAFDQRAWQKAKDFFTQSLALWEEENNQRMIAWGLTNFGTTLWALKEYDKAIAITKKAIDLFDNVHDPVHKAAAQMNLGNVYLTLERPNDALTLYLSAEPIFRKAQDRVRLGIVNNNRGMAYHKLQQWENAIHAYQLSIHQRQQMGHVTSLVNVMDNLGLTYLEQGAYKEAIAIFQNALNQLEHVEHKPTHNRLFTMVNQNLQRALALST